MGLLFITSTAFAECKYAINIPDNDYAKNLVDSALSTLNIDTTDYVYSETSDNIALSLRAGEYSGQTAFGFSIFKTYLIASRSNGEVIAFSDVVSCTAPSGQSCQKSFRHKQVFKATRDLVDRVNCHR